MDRKVFLISFLIIVFITNGCRTNEISQKKIDSDKVDSLINVIEINDRIVIVKFGSDAVTAIKTSKGIVLIDAGISTFLTGRYKRIIENHFNLDKFCYVINTHGHHDHVRGNSLFPEAQIIGHEYCHKDASDRGASSDSLLIKIRKTINDYDQQLQNSIPNTAGWNDSFTQKTRYMCSYLDVENNVPFKLPDITFSDSMMLECGNITFEMIYFGKLHSDSDVLIYVPEIQTLFTGDLFSKYGRPGMNSTATTDEDRWVHAIKWTRKRMNNIRTIVDGHGLILTTDDLESFNDNLLKKVSSEVTK